MTHPIPNEALAHALSVRPRRSAGIGEPMSELESAARAYVLARESGRPTTSAYRKLRRAWVAAVRADAFKQGMMLIVSPKWEQV